MTVTDVYKNVHGVDEFYIVYEEAPVSGKPRREAKRSNVPVLASTVQKTKLWIRDVMLELEWDDAPIAYHGLRAVLHALRDRLTIHEAADFASQLPMLLRGMFYEGWHRRDTRLPNVREPSCHCQPRECEIEWRANVVAEFQETFSHHGTVGKSSVCKRRR